MRCFAGVGLKTWAHYRFHKLRCGVHFSHLPRARARARASARVEGGGHSFWNKRRQSVLPPPPTQPCTNLGTPAHSIEPAPPLLPHPDPPPSPARTPGPRPRRGGCGGRGRTSGARGRASGGLGTAPGPPASTPAPAGLPGGGGDDGDSGRTIGGEGATTAMARASQSCPPPIPSLSRAVSSPQSNTDARKPHPNKQQQ